MKKVADRPAPFAPAQSSAAPPAPSHEEIVARAEALWRERGCPEGRDDEIWLEAEQQLFRGSPEHDKRDVISATNPRFKLDQDADDRMREFDERFSESTDKETTSL